MQMEPLILPKLLEAVSDPGQDLLIQYVRRLQKQLKYASEEATKFLKETMISITNILKDPNIHPKVKYLSHRMIMYLIFMADPQIYQHFSNSIYPILRANCMYNKAAGIEVRGQDFFKQSKFFTNPSASAAEKAEIKKYGILYIIFCLQTVYKIALWLPYDLQDDTKPTNFAISYDNLLKSGVEFPKQENLRFYTDEKVQEKEKIIREIQKQFQSILSSQVGRSSLASHKKNQNRVSSVSHLNMISNQHPLNTQFKNLLKSSLAKKENNNNSVVLGQIDQMYIESKSKIFLLQDEKNKLLKQIDIQRNFYQSELEKQRRVHRQNILKYEKKITKMEQQIQKLRLKINSLESRSSQIPNPNTNTNTNLNNTNFNNTNIICQSKSNDRMRQKVIEDLQTSNKALSIKIKGLEEQIKKYEAMKKVGSSPHNLNVNQGNVNESISVMSVEIQKLKKQNKSLKAKLLTQCSQASQFSTRSNAKTQNSQREPQSLKFLGYEDSRSCFQPFYSNSSSQIKIRLRKAILRQKQLLYRDKNIEIGCITKLQGINSIRLITVFTNISQKPLFNFAIDYISREDIVIKMIQNTKNYLQISGQTKSEVYVSINQIDFRCLLCSVRYNIQQQTQKSALIMPISKLKLATQLVYTPIKKSQKLKKIQKLFQSDKKILPNIHKFKDYFELALLEVDRTMHETYYLKMMFMGIKLYVECDEVEGQLRTAVKYYEDEEYSRAEKLLEELGFLFGKG